MVFGTPFLEDIRDRGGDPEIVREAVEKAIETELGSELELHALVVEGSLE